MEMTKPLEKEYEYYLTIWADLAREHAGRFVAIKDKKILGIYADYIDASTAVYAEHEYGSVLMQELGRDWAFVPTVWLLPEAELRY